MTARKIRAKLLLKPSSSWSSSYRNHPLLDYVVDAFQGGGGGGGVLAFAPAMNLFSISLLLLVGKESSFW